MGKENKHKPLELYQVNYLNQMKRPIILNFNSFGYAEFDIPGVVDIGDPILFIESKDFIGIVPKKEFSIQNSKPSESFVGKSRKGFVKSIYDLENNDGSLSKLIIFSTKEYELDIKEDVLNEIENSDILKATVTQFSEYGAILNYKGIILELNDGAFSKKTISTKTIFSIGDTIYVKFKKFRNNKRKILVSPIIPFPKPDYLKELSLEDIDKDKTYNAEIRKLTANKIIVSIGRNDKNNPINVICKYPLSLLGYISKDIPVRVKITNSDKKNKILFGFITDINRDFVDDSIFEYQRLIDEYEFENKNKDKDEILVHEREEN